MEILDHEVVVTFSIKKNTCFIQYAHFELFSSFKNVWYLRLSPRGDSMRLSFPNLKTSIETLIIHAIGGYYVCTK